MIEVERKFLFDDVLRARLMEHAKETTKKEMSDVYWDFPDCSLTLADQWLRIRSVEQTEGEMELKVPISSQRGKMDAYEEIQGPEEIARRLNLNRIDLLKGGFELCGLTPFAKIHTKRFSILVEYKGKEIRIDLDEMDFGYSVGEVEILVETPDQVSQAENLIISFSHHYDISTTEFIPGKLVAFLRLHRPSHLQALVKAGVMSHLSH